jgi:hypothetical protein
MPVGSRNVCLGRNEGKPNYYEDNGCPWDQTVCSNAVLQGHAIDLFANALGFETVVHRTS